VDSSHPPVILVLQEAPVRPAHDHGREQVLPLDEERSHVELGRQTGVLAHPDGPPVDVDVEDALRTSHVKHYPPSLPGARQLEAQAVETGRVLFGNRGRTVREGHLDVGVVGAVVALQRPVAGDLDLAPGAVVELRLGEARRRRLRLRDQVELPAAVESLEPGGLRPLVPQCRPQIRKRDQRAATRQPMKSRTLGLRPRSTSGDSKSQHLQFLHERFADLHRRELSPLPQSIHAGHCCRLEPLVTSRGAGYITRSSVVFRYSLVSTPVAGSLGQAWKRIGMSR